jgi:hypothetical protein
MALTKVQLVDLNANELIIDLDADTSITADTDDQIDIKIAGADDFRFTANTFTALAGSSIVVPDSGLTLGSTAVTSTAAELNLLDGVSGLVQADLTKLAAIDATATELNLIDGGATVGTTTVASGDGVITNDGGTMRVTNIDTFDTYLSATTKTLTNKTLTTPIIAEIDSGSTITLDATTDIILDADGGDIFFKDAGTTFGSATNTSGNLIIKSGTTTALTFSGANVTGAGTLQGTTITATTAFVPDAANGATLGTTALEFADLFLHDGAQILFGADQDVVLTHAADAGLTLKTATTSDDTKATLTLQTGDTDIAVNDVLGQLHFQAPDEGAGTDAVLVAAGIAAISEGDFSASNNATKLSFQTGASEAASEKMSLSSAGILTVADDIIIGDGKTIGSVSDPDAITIASNGQLTLTQTLIGTALDISGDIDVDGTTNLDIVDIDGAVNIAADVTIASTNKIIFNDASQFIQGASNAILDIAATDEIELTATLIEVVGNATVSGTLGVTGVTTSNAGVVVDNITIDGTEIDLSSGDLTVDVAGDIILDAGGGDLLFNVATTNILAITNSSSDVIIKPVVDAKDIIFQQRDGTSILEINDGAYARFTAAAVAPEATLSDASTVTWNALTQSVSKVTLGGNRTIGLASGGVSGAFISILIIQDGTGSRTVSWNAAYEFAADTAPTLTTTANLGDLFVFRYNGAKWLEVGRNLALTLS